MIDALTGAFGLYLGTFAVCFVSGLVPLVNADIYLLGLSGWAIHDPSQIPLIVVLAAAGQMVAKVLMYYATVRALAATAGGRRRARLDKWVARVERWQNKRYWMIAASGALGVPPFYIISIMAAVFRIPFRNFLVIGTVGRLVRFAVIMVIPIREILHAVGSAVGC